MLGPLSALLHHLAASKLSATALAVAGSLATAVLSFVVMPTMDWVLGRDLRAPSEVRGVGGLLGNPATAVLSFVVVPTMNWALGRDLRAPTEVSKRYTLVRT